MRGVGSFYGATHRIGLDYFEVGFFFVLGVVIGGDLWIEDLDIENMCMIRFVFSRLGIEVREELKDG